MTTRPKVPSYRFHKARGLAVVTIRGKDCYLGPYDSPESWEKYHRLIAEFLADPQFLVVPPPLDEPLSIQRLCLAYSDFADGYYVKDGRKTAEVYCITSVLRRLIKLFGQTPADEFGPKALKLLRDDMVADQNLRGTINSYIARVKRMFRWAVENELLPVTVYQALVTVPGLRKGRCAAQDAQPIRPVDDQTVNSTMPFLAPPVAAMVQLQRITGCRPGEICILRPNDLDRKGDVWCYRPGSHKVEHHGLERRIFLGPRSQEILLPWLERSPSAFCFSPAEAVAFHRQEKAARRKTPQHIGNRAGTNCKTQPRRQPGDHYSTASYRRAIERACCLAFPPPVECLLNAPELTEAEATKRREIVAEWRRAHTWHPNQLRHSRATELRRLHGLDAAQVVLGHTEAFVTELYAERDFQKAEEIMRQSG